MTPISPIPVLFREIVAIAPVRYNNLFLLLLLGGLLGGGRVELPSSLSGNPSFLPSFLPSFRVKACSSLALSQCALGRKSCPYFLWPMQLLISVDLAPAAGEIFT